MDQDGDLEVDATIKNPTTRELLGESFCKMFEESFNDGPTQIEKASLDCGQMKFDEPVAFVPQTKLVSQAFSKEVLSSNQSTHDTSTSDASQMSSSSDVEPENASYCAARFCSEDQSTHDANTMYASQQSASDSDRDVDFLLTDQDPLRQVTLPEPEPLPSTPACGFHKVGVSTATGGGSLHDIDDGNASNQRTRLRSEAKEFTPGALGFWQDVDQETRWTWLQEHAQNKDAAGVSFGTPFEDEMLARMSVGLSVASTVGLTAHLRQLQVMQKAKECHDPLEELDLPKSGTPKPHAAVSRREQAAIANVVQQNMHALKMRNFTSTPSTTSCNPSRPSVSGDSGKPQAKQNVRRFCQFCGKDVMPFFKFCASCGGRIDV